MNRSARSAAIIGLLLGLGGGCGGQAGPDEEGRGHDVANASEPTIFNGNDLRNEAAEDPPERTIVDRFEQPDPALTLPAAFQGSWASRFAECRGSEWVRIEAGGFRAPDWIAVLVEPVRIVRQLTPDGVPAQTFTVRIEQAGEGDALYPGRLQVSRAGEHLYMSNAEIVGAAEHWQHRNVRCPRPERPY